MLKKRIIATLPVYNNIAVQSIGFNRYLPLGKPEIAIEFLNQWGIDEIIVLEIDARLKNVEIDSKKIQSLAKKCFVPLTYGGGINNLNDVHTIIHNGADKVSLNQPVLHQPNLITEIANKYGNQCIVASIDVMYLNNEWKVFDYLNKKISPIKLETLIKRSIDAGAGELFINSIDRDGSYIGYDIPLIKFVCSLVNIPVLGCGGAKNPKHMLELLSNTEVSGAVAGNFFHFSEHSVTIAKKYLAEKNNLIRLETHFTYKNNLLDKNFRLDKKSDFDLEHLLYTKIEKEII